MRINPWTGKRREAGGMGMSGKSVQLIVTADDFGLSEKVNDGILEAFHKGVVRNTTVMVNYPDFEASVEFLKEAPELDVGIHLNLTSGPPVLSPDRVSSLVDRQGKFLGLGPFLARVALGRIQWSEVRMEWQAQIERGINRGCRFSSITSHQHIHMLPPLAKACASLAQENGIPAVRLSRYPSSHIFWPPSTKALAINSFSSAAWRRLNQGKVYTNNYIIEIPSAPIKTALERFRGILRKLPAGVHELVCHPGYVDSKLKDRDTYTVQRLFELEVVTSLPVRQILGEQKVELTTYRSFVGM